MENRKYFDYELAYEMYKKAKELFAKGGLEELEKHFDNCGDKENGYISYYGNDYNAWVYLVNKNFDTDKEEDWYVSGEVDMISYGEGDDNIYINSKDMINERINGLLSYTKENDYALEDIYKEYESLEKVLELLREEK